MTRKYEKRIVIDKICLNCNKKYKTKFETQKYCCKVCKNLHQKITQIGRKYKPKYGKENSNYGNKWSEEQKLKQSDLIKSKVNDEYRFKCGSPRRGKKLDRETIIKMHGNREKSSYSHPHTKESKLKIGIKSKEKFTPEYFKKIRSIMEKNGSWVPLSKKEDRSVYFKESNWNKKLFDVLYSKYKILIETYGIFNSTKNSRGCVRDHIFSRQSAFDLGVFPEIVRHIENCQIILHKDNVKKAFTKKDGISLEQLFEKIEKTSHVWEEQEICLKLIEDYKNGKRWINRWKED
jgi:hypothetical protein